MLKRRDARLMQHVCVMLTLAIVLFELPDWAVAAAVIPAVVLLADCVTTWYRGGRRE